jgi:hypothetical protein
MQRCAVIHIILSSSYSELIDCAFLSDVVVGFYGDERKASSVRGVLCESASLPVSLDLSAMEMTDACAAGLPWTRICKECTAIDLSSNQLTSFPRALAELDPSRCQEIKFSSNPIPLDAVHCWTSECANAELASRVLTGTYACGVGLKSCVYLVSPLCSR